MTAVHKTSARIPQVVSRFAARRYYRDKMSLDLRGATIQTCKYSMVSRPRAVSFSTARVLKFSRNFAGALSSNLRLKPRRYPITNRIFSIRVTIDEMILLYPESPTNSCAVCSTCDFSQNLSSPVWRMHWLPSVYQNYPSTSLSNSRHSVLKHKM